MKELILYAPNGLVIGKWRINLTGYDFSVLFRPVLVEALVIKECKEAEEAKTSEKPANSIKRHATIKI